MKTKCFFPRHAIFSIIFFGLTSTHANTIDTSADVSGFNFVIGTQTFGAAYHFTSNVPLIETARGIQSLGSHVIKFAIAATNPALQGTLVQIATNDPAVRQTLDMPFPQEVLWALPDATKANLFDPGNLEVEYRQLYDLAVFLRKNYINKRRTFYLGNWEGDWELTRMGTREPSDTDIQNMINWGKARQRAVDDAKRDTPDSDVHVFYYIEVNRTGDSMQGKRRVTNEVLQEVNPDFVSYSAYDSLSEPSLRQLVPALDYIQNHLSYKPELPSKRVFIGEFGFAADKYGKTQQALLTKHVISIALNWGCPLILYWEFYNNEIQDGAQRGYWMIDNHATNQPVYFIFKKYYASASRYVKTFARKNGRMPNEEEFRNAAGNWIS